MNITSKIVNNNINIVKDKITIFKFLSRMSFIIRNVVDKPQQINPIINNVNTITILV